MGHLGHGSLSVTHSLLWCGVSPGDRGIFLEMGGVHYEFLHRDVRRYGLGRFRRPFRLVNETTTQ